MKPRDIFHSAALKLTAYYLAIILIISLIFTSTLYHLAANEIKREVLRPAAFNQLVLDSSLTYQQYRQQQIDDALHNLRGNLVLFNLAVLLFGGLASYWLARRTLEPIAEALDSQSRFTADASHELRTPLTVMQTENEVTLRDPNLTKDQAKAQLKSNLEEVAKLKALSEGLLTLATNKGLEDLGQEVSSAEIVKSAIDRLAKAAAAKKIKLSSAAKNFQLCGNPEQLIQLVAILLDNAIKYGPLRGAVELKAQRRGKLAAISVRDRGPGIPPADLPHIFERFYRADASRSKAKTDGYGLGLAIAKKIADAHHGVIEVRSKPGQGATFTILLPLN